MTDRGDNSLRRLRKRVERALAGGERDANVVRDLETLVRETGDGEQDALFAHRQLAELRLESSPWHAALHLRQLIRAEAADDGVFALMGLCQAMLGNFRCAITAYTRAIETAPKNPWYRHNLGHLLDVGLGSPRSALRHLELAHDVEPAEDEITASLSHCLARLGRLDEARVLAVEALKSAPNNADHRALLEWIERGAPGTRAHRREQRDGTRGARAIASVRREVALDDVSLLLAARMPVAGFSEDQVQRAQALWLDFARRKEARGVKPGVYAAAIEYAMAMVDGLRVTQASTARRYEVTPAALAGRYAEIRGALELVPGDPRYGCR